MQTPPSGFSISTIAIRRSIATLVLTIAVIVLGAFFTTRLQVDLLPSITYPRIGVEVNAPGISPDVAVDEITRPLEQALSATEGVEQVFSRTQEGRVRLDLFFRPGGNIDQALNDATATFSRNRNRLPEVIEEPRIFKFDPSQLPVYEFALRSETLSEKNLRVFADEELARELNVIPGVAAVDVSGGLREEVQVKIDLNRMQGMGVGMNDVLTALRERNQDVSGGRLEGSTIEPLTRAVGQFQTAAEIRDLSFEVSGLEGTGGTEILALPRRVYLRDFADVIDGTEEQRLSVWLNGQPAVRVTVQKQPDANTIVVVDSLKQKLAVMRQQGLLTDDITLVTTLDESRFIRDSISNVVTAGLVGTLLAAIAVLLFLGSLRQTLIITLAIPLSTLIAIILMSLFGLSLNVFSLGGLALGVGIVVDNSIVMLENIVKGVQEQRLGALPNSTNLVIEQAELSSQQVESALIASTSTNLVAVLPFLLLGGFISLLFNELILTISFAVAASILVAVTVVPALAASLLAIPQSSRINQFWLLQEFERRFQGTIVSYGRFLDWLLKHRITALVMAFLLLGGSSWLLAGQLSQELVPRISTGQVNLNAQFPAGTTLATNRQVMTLVDGILLAQPETDYTFTTVGGSLFGNTSRANVLQGRSTITLKPGLKAETVETYIKRVEGELEKLNLTGIRLRLSPGRVRGLILTNSPTIGSDLDVTLVGSDARSLTRAGRQVLSALDDQVKLARFRPDADPRQPEVQILPDWERLSALNLTTQDIGETIQTAIVGTIPTRLQRADRLIDIRVQLDKSQIQDPSQLAQIPLSVAGNQPIRLGDVARIEDGLAPGEIQRLNQRQVFLIIGTLAKDPATNKSAKLSDAATQVQTALASVKLPEGVQILPSSSTQTNQALQQALWVLGGLAAFLVFVVMAVQYNSLIDPLVIMLTVPLALAGGILGLYITSTAIGITVLVGAVLLVGIVVNNAIIMVELANQIRDLEGVDHQTAILKAAPQRLRPILMTTITTVLGMFPLALGVGQGAELLQPLGVVIFSGLSLATLLTLFIIPCTYVLFHGFKTA